MEMSNQEKSRRIYWKKGQNDFSSEQAVNLLWVKQGRVFYFSGAISGELAARVLRFIQETYPLNEIDESPARVFLEGAEEALQIDGDEIVPIRQVGEIQLGRVRLLNRAIQRFLAGG